MNPKSPGATSYFSVSHFGGTSMHRQNRARLTVEPLEQRWTPAHFSMHGSTLFVSHPSGPAPTLTATINTNNTITVTDDGLPPVTFAATALHITGNNLKNNITVNGAGTLAGSLFIKTGLASDTVTVGAHVGGDVVLNLGGGSNKATVTGPARNVVVNSGNGNDSITVSGALQRSLAVLSGDGNDTITASGAIGGNFVVLTGTGTGAGNDS